MLKRWLFKLNCQLFPTICKVVSILPDRVVDGLGFALCELKPEVIATWAPKFRIQNDHIELVAVSRRVMDKQRKERQLAFQQWYEQYEESEKQLSLF